MNPAAGAPKAQEWLRVADIAEAFDVSPKTVNTWIHAGLLKAIRTPGGHFRIPAEELDRLLAESTSTQVGA